MIHLRRLCSASISSLLLAGASWLAHAEVQVSKTADRVDIQIDGKPFTQYHFKDVSRPFLYPIIGPNGARMTRDWPMGDTPNEEHDHPHHKSFWFAHGDANGVDFWSESDKAGKTVQTAITRAKGGKKQGVLVTRNDWIAKDGKKVASDERTYTFHASPAGRFIDFKVTITPHDADLVLGDTKEGTMAIRLAETMRLKGKVGKGHIVNSDGIRDGETWGKRAKWVDYYGPVEDKTVGVAIFDTPSNPRYPTWWHVRDYGLFAANPFGLHDFEKKPKNAGDMTIAKGTKVTFQYRFFFHTGNEQDAKVQEEFNRYTKHSGGFR